jgi:hypothetical protein
MPGSLITVPDLRRKYGKCIVGKVIQLHSGTQTDVHVFVSLVGYRCYSVPLDSRKPIFEFGLPKGVVGWEVDPADAAARFKERWAAIAEVFPSIALSDKQ